MHPCGSAGTLSSSQSHPGVSMLLEGKLGYKYFDLLNK